MAQYGFGYCSVRYAAADDQKTQYVYAVCDHRLDGPPIQEAVRDYFGVESKAARIVPEIEVPHLRSAIDFVAITTDQRGDISKVVAIESQSIDLRGGGVGPAWQAWEEGRPREWRSYFTAAAKAKGRKDQVAYGVNMANIYKRLGLQVAAKGEYLKRIGVPLYVVMQERTFRYLKRRIDFTETTSERADITFVTFEYTGRTVADGTLEFLPVRKVRTTLSSYVKALSARRPGEEAGREEFLDQIKRKAGLSD